MALTTEPLLPTSPSQPFTSRGPGPLWSLGPVQGRQPRACGQGHRTVLQILQGPLLAAPTTVLVPGSMSHDYTPGPPPMQCPPPTPSPGPTQSAPALLYACPGSAVTYTAERYSYGRMGQKETEVRCPPMPGGTGPLDQAGPHACCLALPPPMVAPALALAAVSLLLPPEDSSLAYTCLSGAATSKSPALPAPATSHQPPSL